MKNFIFDLYNTLIEVRTNEHCERAWLPVIDGLAGRGVKTDWQTLARLFDGTWTEFIKKAEAAGKYNYPECDEVQIFIEIARSVGATVDYNAAQELLLKMRIASTEILKPFDGIGKLFTGLRKGGAKIYLLSNAQAAFTYNELEKCGLKNAFDGMLLSSECGVRKPDKMFFKMLFDKYGLKKSESVMVGDDLSSDGLGAESFGILFIRADGGAPKHRDELFMALGERV